MKIAFFEVQNWEKHVLSQGFQGHQIKLYADMLDEKNVTEVKDFDVISVFIYSKVTSDVLTKLEKLRLIATRSTGFDHIDLAACRQRGITVCNVPTYGEISVAEHAFALILSLSRMIHDSYERTRRGDFSCQGVQGFDLNGKTLGVLGTGRIGHRVIEIAKGFEMKVIAFDKYPNREAAQTLGYTYVDATSLLRQSDF